MPVSLPGYHPGNDTGNAAMIFAAPGTAHSWPAANNEIAGGIGVSRNRSE
jgi:hypothetical protein